MILQAQDRQRDPYGEINMVECLDYNINDIINVSEGTFCKFYVKITKITTQIVFYDNLELLYSTIVVYLQRVISLIL